MEFIKKGKVPKEEFWVGTCNKCNSILRAEGSELKITDDQLFAHADCKLCGKDVWFDLEKDQ